MINETLKNFIQPHYAKAKRGPETYASTFAYTYAQLEAALAEYRSCSEDVQTRRLIRDTIDYHLRRCHGYCIKENFGSHYRQRNVEGKKVFEHMIPNKTFKNQDFNRTFKKVYVSLEFDIFNKTSEVVSLN